jgi:4-diphosphocytidyl-2-C-methyl-D-erythritol kinase
MSSFDRPGGPQWVAASASIAAPAKINLSLKVVGRRADGYHLIDSAVAPIGLYDDIHIDVGSAGRTEVSISCDPPDAAPSDDTNLAARAAKLFLSAVGTAARVSIRIAKRIPAGAGLGGGSSDAAAVLRTLNVMSGRPLPEAELAASALSLGADVPLFLFGRPARMRGIGEILEPHAVHFARPVVIAHSGMPLSTASVYAKYDDLLTMSAPVSIVRASGREPLRTILLNDLEAAAFRVQPGLQSLKRRLCSLGAEGVLMTGSGSAIFGIWQHWDDASASAERLRSAGIWARVVRILDRVPAPELDAT